MVVLSFSFNIEGFKVNFYLADLERESAYMMKKMGGFALPRCLNNSPSFVSMKTINETLQRGFRRESAQLKKRVQHA